MVSKILWEFMTELITTKEAAALLKCDPSTVNGYVRKGRLSPAKRIGGKLLFKREVISDFKRPVQMTKNPRFNGRGQSGLEKSDLLSVVEKWRVNSKDNSSADVQIGIYTEKIIELEKKIKNTPLENPNFRNMRYTLVRHVGERRKLLSYLEMSDFKRYRRAVELIRKESA